MYCNFEFVFGNMYFVFYEVVFNVIWIIFDFFKWINCWEYSFEVFVFWVWMIVDVNILLRWWFNVSVVCESFDYFVVFMFRWVNVL